MATAGVLMKKVLGGAGKGIAKIANAVDDAEAVMKNAAMNATDAISDAYRTTRMQSAKVIDEMEEGIRDATGKKIKKPKIIKEARVPSNESSNVVNDAISHTKRQVKGSNKNSDITYSQKDGKYFRQAGSSKPIELTEEQYKMHLNGQDKELAQQLSESADAWSFSDIANWASENQGIATAIAVGGGMAAGGLLFGGDND